MLNFRFPTFQSIVNSPNTIGNFTLPLMAKNCTNCCFWPRGKVLGSSSAINQMIYIRGNRRDFDLWASKGNKGWGYESVLPFFKKLQ